VRGTREKKDIEPEEGTMDGSRGTSEVVCSTPSTPDPLTADESENGYRRLTVEADWSELSDDYDGIVAGYLKVPVLGFRPGKVPRNIIETRFQKEIIEELSRRAAEHIGRDAVREAGIEALGPVEAMEIECAKGGTFRARLRYHPMPTIDLPDINNLAIDNGDVDPRDQISLRLLELVSFDVPEKLVKDELDLDGIGETVPGGAEWKEATDRIKLMLILKKIARQEGIEVDEADVNNRMAEKAKEFGTTIKSLQEELDQGGGLSRLRDMLIAESTLDYLLEKNK
jgi:FKBP-type peptidyl-prolyl cis-trans isomerase (trigger factor)